MNCDYCVYTNIVKWERKEAKATPEYWCERYNKFCDDIAECEYKAEKGEKIDAN